MLQLQQIQHSIFINSTKEKIWKILIDVEQWEVWDNAMVNLAAICTETNYTG